MFGNRTKSIKEWEAFQKSSEWLDIMDFVNSEIESATNIMLGDHVNQKDFKIARDRRGAFQYLKELPNLIIDEIKLEKESKGKSTNILENNITGEDNE